MLNISHIERPSIIPLTYASFLMYFQYILFSISASCILLNNNNNSTAADHIFSLQESQG
jgi:hypothetical protein